MAKISYSLVKIQQFGAKNSIWLPWQRHSRNLKFFTKNSFLAWKANFYAKFEANLRTSTYHPLHDFYMNLYLNII